MIYDMSNRHLWEQGDGIEVAGTLCKNPHDAMIVHIGNFYAESTEPIKPHEDATEMFKVGWIDRNDFMDINELVEFLKEHKEEFQILNQNI